MLVGRTRDFNEAVLRSCVQDLICQPLSNRYFCFVVVLTSLVEQVDAVFPEPSAIASEITAELVDKRLPICDAAFKESLRRHPVAPFMAHEVCSR